MPVYNSIGLEYDTTRRADPYITARIAQHLTISPEAYYLDVACGTGNYTVALAEDGGFWHGVDQSPVMIAAARAKSDTVRWQVASVNALPFTDATFSGVVCTLAIHHFESLLPAFCGIRRVLNDGRFVLFTSTREQMHHYWLADYFPRAIQKSAEQMPSLEAILQSLSEAGFVNIETEIYQVQEDLKDFFLYSGKQRPEIYLDAQVRANISTFALLANDDEVRTGCDRLRIDIGTGRIKQIIEERHSEGDYLFVIATP